MVKILCQLCIACAALLTQPTLALAPGCPQCANWWNQIATKYEIVLTKVAQINQLQVQLNAFNLALKEGRPIVALASQVPGFNEFAHAHRLLWQTQEAVNDMQQWSGAIEDTFDSFNALLEGDTYSKVYAKWAKKNEAAAKRAYKQMGLHVEDIKARDEILKKLHSKIQTDSGLKQIAQSTAELIALVVKEVQSLEAVLIGQRKDLIDATRKEQEQAKMSAKALAEHKDTAALLRASATGWKVMPGQEFNSNRH